MGRLAVLGPEGDVSVEWDAANEEEVRVARSTFARLREKGYSAFDEEGGGRVDAFDAGAGRVFMVPPMRGG